MPSDPVNRAEPVPRYKLIEMIAQRLTIISKSLDQYDKAEARKERTSAHPERILGCAEDIILFSNELLDIEKDIPQRKHTPRMVVRRRAGEKVIVFSS